MSGGAALTLVDERASSPHWASDGRIYFVATEAGGGQGSAISRVSAGGGAVETVIADSAGSRIGRYIAEPYLLPGGRGLLLRSRGEIYAASLPDGRLRRLVPGQNQLPQFVEPGYIVYLGVGGLMEFLIYLALLAFTRPGSFRFDRL